MIPDPSTLVAGQILGYHLADDLADFLIERTGPIAHVELYLGNGESLASRNGIGVGRYPLRMEGITAILTPTFTVDMDAILKWFDSVNGQPYDFTALSGFVFGENRQTPEHLFCSAFVALAFIRTQQPILNKLWPPALTTPTDLLKSPLVRWQWIDTAHFTA